MWKIKQHPQSLSILNLIQKIKLPSLSKRRSLLEKRILSNNRKKEEKYVS
jgi:hypothetical protein